MKIIKRFILLVFVFLLVIQTQGIASEYVLFNDMHVGTKINDSTGNLTISNAAIQNVLIPQIKMLNGVTLVAGTARLSIGSGATYLLFKGTKAANDTVVVAIELLATAQNALFFRE